MTSPQKPKLWHCYNSRSLRVLWALEELEIDYDLEVMPFPPRFRQPGYKDLNVLGTVPYFEDGDVSMTESVAICHYLVDAYKKHEFGLTPDHPEYGRYLNWLYQSDATLTFPLSIYLRYSSLEPQERRQPQVASDYRKWHLARLRALDNHMIERQYLCDERFTIADIAVGFALLLGKLLQLDADYTPQVQRYLARLEARPAFKRTQAIAPETDPYKGFEIGG